MHLKIGFKPSTFAIRHSTLPQMIGRIDVHSHLLPGIDDGCRDVKESIACAKLMVEAGYAHSFCTPHIWPNLGNTIETIAPRVKALQAELDKAGVPLTLYPGGEMHISGTFCETDPDQLVTYNNLRQYAIFDFWTERLPPYFNGCLQHIRKAGIQPILAHPERIDAVQNDPDKLIEFTQAGLFIQCNLECLGDPIRGRRQELAERWLMEDRYFLLGSDLHRIETLPVRLRGLERAIQLVGEEQVWKLTHTNPMKLVGTV